MADEPLSAAQTVELLLQVLEASKINEKMGKGMGISQAQIYAEVEISQIRSMLKIPKAT